MTEQTTPTKKPMNPNRAIILVASGLAALISVACFAVGYAIYTTPHNKTDEDWVVFAGGGAFVAANVGEKTSAGLWVAAISKDPALPEFEPSIALSFFNVDCKQRRYRITTRMKQFDSGVTRTASSKDAPWEAVPPSSVVSPERTTFDIFCDEGDPEYRSLPGTPLQFREVIREAAEEKS